MHRKMTRKALGSDYMHDCNRYENKIKTDVRQIFLRKTDSEEQLRTGSSVEPANYTRGRHFTELRL
jgi:hypothetical protein